jgi:hypothetical protein
MHNCIISHAQNTTALNQLNLILTGLYQLLVTNKGGSTFHRANHCQGQLQTPQSVAALYI